MQTSDLHYNYNSQTHLLKNELLAITRITSYSFKAITLEHYSNESLVVITLLCVYITFQ